MIEAYLIGSIINLFVLLYLRDFIKEEINNTDDRIYALLAILLILLLSWVFIAIALYVKIFNHD